MENHIKLFETEEEAKQFSEEVGGTYGWMKNEDDEIKYWYVDYE